MKQMKPQLNYVEFPSKDLALTQDFFETVFGWVFTSYGEDYIAFSAQSAGLEGGFYKSELKSEQKNGSALIVEWNDGESAKVLETKSDIDSFRADNLLSVSIARPTNSDHIVNCPFIDPFQ